MTPPSGRSYAVRIWNAAVYRGKRGKSYRVRWRTGSRTHGRTFATMKAAESFRSELLTAHRKGEPFDPDSGLPPSMQPISPSVSWLGHACDFVDFKWPHVSARHRKGLAEALTTVTMALWDSEPSEGQAERVRDLLRNWAFNTRARPTPPLTEANVDSEAEVVPEVGWAEAHSLPLDDLMDPMVCRRAVDACGLKLDGEPSAPATAARKRSALYSCLEYAFELGRLPSNPMTRIKVKRTANQDAVDRRVVVNPGQARALLAAVRDFYPSLEAFFACLYYAGLRPAEARHLRKADLTLPASGWGELTLRGSTQAGGSAWTDAGSADEDRSLKHRVSTQVRLVPAHPELVAILLRHLDAFACSPDGRLFVVRAGIGGRPLPSPFSKPMPMGTAYRVWKEARARALTPEQVESPLARRPYDLRHACVSTWLNAGVPATQVAEWAGHSVNVLLRVYAKCVYGQEEQARRRIDAALGGP